MGLFNLDPIVVRPRLGQPIMLDWANLHDTINIMLGLTNFSPNLTHISSLALLSAQTTSFWSVRCPRSVGRQTQYLL